MSPTTPPVLLLALRFPRVSGDEPEWFGLVPGFNAFSPRERG